MSHKRKDSLVVSREWAKHLRPFEKRNVAKRERMAIKREISKQLNQF